MKKTLVLIILSGLLFTQFSSARTVDVEVHGMTCAFCVDSLERKFRKMKSVSKVEVSLKLKKVRLETSETLPTVEVIKQTIINSGFTPVKVSIVSNEQK
jgi:copper chaperone CopZ